MSEIKLPRSVARRTNELEVDFNQVARTIIVTGGAGFLGSQLCRRIIDAGHNVICVDNLQTGRRKNIEPLVGSPRFRLITHDIILPLSVEEDVHEIYNLACAASPPRYQIDPIHTMKTCVLGTMNMLGLAKRKGARLLQASTSEVYGDPSIDLQNEDYRGNVNCFGPRACYDEGKRAAEALCFDYGRQHGLDVRVVRIFNTYGPHMSPDDGRVVSNFIIQALRGAPITVYGDGSQTRSFCYADDLLDGFIRVMAAPVTAEISRPINLGNPGEFTVRELAEIVISKTGSRSKIVHVDLPVDDPRQRRPDICRAKVLLGWEPRVSLGEGLDRTIAYFRNDVEDQRALAVVAE
jgi:UDP-glucuronate decarboxylase